MLNEKRGSRAGLIWMNWHNKVALSAFDTQ